MMLTLSLAAAFVLASSSPSPQAPPLQDRPPAKTSTPAPTPVVQPKAPQLDSQSVAVVRLKPINPPIPANTKFYGSDRFVWANTRFACVQGMYPANKTTADAENTLWVYSTGSPAPGTKIETAKTLEVQGVNANGAVWGKRLGRYWVWNDRKSAEIKLPHASGRPAGGIEWIKVLDSGRIVGVVAHKPKEGPRLETAFLLEGDTYSWLGLRGGDFEVPGSGARFSTIFGERPDHAIVGSSRRFRPKGKPSDTTESRGVWSEEIGWLFRGGSVLPFTFEPEGSRTRSHARPLRILKSGVVIVETETGVGRVAETTVVPIDFPGLTPGSTLRLHDVTDDGRFLLISSAVKFDEKGGETPGFWHVDGDTVTRIAPPDDQWKPRVPHYPWPYKLAENGVPVFAYKPVRNDLSDGGVRPWIWTDGKADFITLTGSTSSGGTLLHKNSARSRRYIGGWYGAEFGPAGSSKETTPWVYDLVERKQIPLQRGPEHTPRIYGGLVVGISGSGRAMIRDRMHPTKQIHATSQWTPAAGLQTVELQLESGKHAKGLYLSWVHCALDDTSDTLVAEFQFPGQSTFFATLTP